MLINILILGSLHFVSVAEGWGPLNKKTWTYELLSIESSSTDKNLLNFDLRKERLSRGVYSISGDIFLNFDIVDNDGNTVNMKSYRSPRGDGDFKILPLHLPSISWIPYMNSFYKNTFMESLHDCSNLPYFEDTFVGPLEKKQYTLNKCQISQDAFPSHLEEGMYKLVYYGNGTVNWNVIFIIDVQANI